MQFEFVHLENEKRLARTSASTNRSSQTDAHLQPPNISRSDERTPRLFPFLQTACCHGSIDDMCSATSAAPCIIDGGSCGVQAKEVDLLHSWTHSLSGPYVLLLRIS